MKSAENNILLPLDFGKQSMIALDYASYFAKGTNAELYLLYVIEEGNFLSRMFTSPELQKKAYTEAEKMLDDLIEKMNYPYPVKKIIEYGKAYKMIIEVANKIRPKFIIMGKTQEPSFTRKLIGSNSMHVIQETVFPVITIRGANYITDFEKRDRELLLPLDLEKEVREQLTAGIEYAKYFATSIKAITILRENSKGKEMNLLTRLDKAKKIIESAGIECTSQLIKETEKPIYEVINDYAKAENTKLIVIMTHDERKIIDFFVGHTALEILDNAELPVLSVVPSSIEDSIFTDFVDPMGVFLAKE